jgi:hypothetical protein
VTVYLCSRAVPVCDSSNATLTLAGVAVSASGTWQTGWSPWAGQGTWIAGATQTDAAGNVGTSNVFGPFSSWRARSAVWALAQPDPVSGSRQQSPTSAGHIQRSHTQSWPRGWTRTTDPLPDRRVWSGRPGIR